MRFLSAILIVFCLADCGPVAAQAYRRPMRSTRAPYRLDAGDTLAVMVLGVMGEFGDAPVHMPTSRNSDILPCVGHPVPVASDGRVSLPEIPPVAVRGFTVVQAEKAIANAYLSRRILKKKNYVTVNLLRKRSIHVMVFQTATGRRGRNSANIVRLQPNESHVLGALARAGSFDATGGLQVYANGTRRSSELRDGDVMHLKSSGSRVFYASGQLRSGEYELPANRNLNVREAIAVASGSGPNRFFGPSEVLVIRQSGTFRVNLYGPGARTIVQPNDTILLRYGANEVAGNLMAGALVTSGMFLRP